jgi:uncharacterized membrane protein
MKRLLVVVFDGEDKAYKAAKVLERLKDLSQIALNEDAILTKNLQGETTVAHPHPIGPQRAMGGSAVGSLIDMFGAPVGLFIGAVTGALIAASADLVRARVDRDFVDDRISVALSTRAPSGCWVLLRREGTTTARRRGPRGRDVRPADSCPTRTPTQETARPPDARGQPLRRSRVRRDSRGRGVDRRSHRACHGSPGAAAARRRNTRP